MLECFQTSLSRSFGRGLFAALTFLGSLAAFVSKSPAEAPSLDAPAHLIHKGPIEYPEALSELAIYGKVIVTFTVTADGTVEKPTVTFAAHPLFVAASLKSLFASKFAPARFHGLAVPSQVAETFTFEIQRDVFHEGNHPFKVPAHSPPSTPAQFQYDEPPRMTVACDPVYPRELFLKAIGGSADVAFVLGADGRVLAAKVTACTQPEFGAALLAAIETWQFSPPRLNGTPTATLLSRHHHFVPSYRLIANGDSARAVISALRSGAQLATPDVLDTPLRRLYEVSPQYPRQFEAKRIAGEATVQVVIDRDGAVCFPSVISATQPEFGWAAMTAVQQWYYDPPRKNKQPTYVRLVIPFEFKPGATE